LIAVLAGCAGGGVYEESVSYDNGVARECGDGPGLQPCRDADGETYAEETDPDFIELDSNEDLAESAERIRNETPQELEQTIRSMEH
jgi:hypothetical protein